MRRHRCAARDSLEFMTSPFHLRHVWVCLSLLTGFGLGQAAPLPEASSVVGEPVRAIATAGDPTGAAARPVPLSSAQAQESPKPQPRTPRLKFRGSDGTCGCTCASGGTSEADIQKAQEARESR